MTSKPSFEAVIAPSPKKIGYGTNWTGGSWWKQSASAKDAPKGESPLLSQYGDYVYRDSGSEPTVVVIGMHRHYLETMETKYHSWKSELVDGISKAPVQDFVQWEWLPEDWAGLRATNPGMSEALCRKTRKGSPALYPALHKVGHRQPVPPRDPEAQLDVLYERLDAARRAGDGAKKSLILTKIREAESTILAQLRERVAAIPREVPVGGGPALVERLRRLLKDG